jgi:pyrimidine operon attenuation protein/uracil phosphoribosyltransferase
MNNRNQHRLLNEQQIKDVIVQITHDIIEHANESATTLVDHYLRGDAEGLFEIISSWIEQAEDNVITELNTLLNEDSFKHNDDDYHPSYEL